MKSLSSWRAWIEIRKTIKKGGKHMKSLSSWRAWIEIAQEQCRVAADDRVALLMESVD